MAYKILATAVLLSLYPTFAAAVPPDVSAVPSHGNPAAPPDWNGLGDYKNTWDLELSGGLGTALTDEASALAGLVETRMGALWLRGDDFYALGMTAGWMSPDVVYGALEVDWMNIARGLWGQAALGPTVQGALMAKVAVGFSLFGADFRTLWEPGGETVLAVFGRVRIPVRLILFGLTDQ